MSQIRCIYTQDPGFPPKDQHLNAERYQVGDYLVDAVGGEPTLEQVLAMLSPPPDPRRVLDEQEYEDAKIDGQIVAFLNMTPAQLDAWVDANITGAGPRTAFKILGRLAQNAARGKVLR